MIQQSTITKCIRKPTGSRSAHDLPRNIIESLPEQIRNPIFLIQDKSRNSISLISSMADKKNNHILIAIRLNERRKEIQVNEIKSIYGKTNLKEYLEKHIEEDQLNVIDSKKAEILSRVIGLQLPTTLTASSYDKRIALQSRKVNKENVQDKSYLEQIDKYYKKELKSYLAIELGITPDILTQFGASKLPLIMLQSTLTKCTRKVTGSRSAHELLRNIIETLPEQIENPIFIIQDRARESIAVISDAADKNGNKILIAIRLNAAQGKNRINEIKSIYGKTNLKEYFQKNIDKGQLSITDSKKAEILSRVIGLQLPKALINSSYDRRIALQSQKVNKEKTQPYAFQEKSKQSIHRKLENFQKKINQSNGKEHNPAQTKQEYKNR